MESEKPVKQRVTGHRRVNTFVFMARTARSFLKRAQTSEPGSGLDTVASLIFAAFTIEAYLNHLGEKLVPYWSSMERRLSVKVKLEIVAHYANLSIDTSRRPVQTVFELIDFRNLIAHGKSEVLEYEYDFILTPDNWLPEDTAKTKWEEYASVASAERAIGDVEELVKSLHNAAGLGSRPFRRFARASGNIQDIG